MAIIDKPSDYFNTVLYTGNGSTQSITGVNFQTDFTWVKNRSNVSDHILVNSISGVDKNLKSNSTGAEITNAARIISFDTDGLTVGNDVNNSGNTYASWNWLAGGTASSNTDGSITSSVSANQDAGFSIVSWTSLASGSNYTVGHGLGSTPAMIILKGRHESNSWLVYHHKNTSSPETDYLELNSTVATADYPVWNDTAPTSSVFTCGTWSGFDAGGTMIAYCFAEKQGYSKFGSYTGNGSTDGTFVYTGFKPAWVMIKCTSTTESWDIKDNKRNPYNTCDNGLRANQNSADDINTTYHMIDYLSNGFKLRGANQNLVNGSGQSYIYMCFAENPLVSSAGVPCTAR